MNTPPSPGLPYWLAIVAALLAFVLARRRAEHRPIALFLGVMVAIDLVRWYLRARFDLGSPGPYTGTRRLAFHFDQAGFLAWPAGLAALALVVFSHRRPWFPFALWAAVCAALAALYPSPLVRGAGLQRSYLIAYVAGLAAVAATGVSWWNAKRDKPGPEQAILLLLGFVDIARLAPFYGSVFERWGSYAPSINVVLYAVISAIEGGFIWQSSRSS